MSAWISRDGVSAFGRSGHAEGVGRGGRVFPFQSPDGRGEGEPNGLLPLLATFNNRCCRAALLSSNTCRTSSAGGRSLLMQKLSFREALHAGGLFSLLTR